MVISSSNSYSKSNADVVKISSANKINLKKFSQNGQIQIYQSPYRGCYSSIIRDSLRNAALGRKVLLVQFMKGGVQQGIAHSVKSIVDLIVRLSGKELSVDQDLSKPSIKTSLALDCSLAKEELDWKPEVEIADGVKVRVVQSTIVQVLNKTEPAKDI